VSWLAFVGMMKLTVDTGRQTSTLVDISQDHCVN
jgi:hypothetical protein